MNILIVNDDGPHGKGTHALVRALKDEHNLTVVLPQREQSGKSHGLNYLNPLLIQEYHCDACDYDFTLVRGTPADCTIAGFSKICKEKPDLVISGINHGHNAGTCIHYSGTFHAAFEGYLQKFPSIALSAPFKNVDFDYDANWFKNHILPHIITEIQNNKGFFYNINFPESFEKSDKGLIKAFIDSTPMNLDLEERMTPFDTTYYWYCGPDDIYLQKPEPDSDVDLLNRGYATITPIQLNYFDSKAFDAMNDVETWNE